MSRSLIACAMLLAGSAAVNSSRAANLPQLPQVWLDTTMPVQAGSVYTVAANCSDLQARIDAARYGDTIAIPRGVVCPGTYILRNKPSAPGWIVIQAAPSTAAGAQNLPRPGVRATPNDASVMPKIVAGGSDPAIRTEPAAHHYRLVGLDIGVSTAASINYGLVMLGDPSAAQNSLSLVPTDIVVDRCYIHGNPHQAVKIGVALNSARTAVVDSYISEIHNTAQDTQAIGGFNGPGPYKIVNNYLEAAGENIMFGGALTSIAYNVPSDIEIRGNYVTKPLSWKIGSATYTGDNYTVKNLFELKNARRVLVEGNILEHNWPQGQNGYSILFTVRTEYGQMPWAVIEDVTFRQNIVRHVAAGFNIPGYDGGSGTLSYGGSEQRILIKDNVFEDVSIQNWGGEGTLFQVGAGVADVTIDHNTSAYDDKILVSGVAIPSPRFVATNNIFMHGRYGMSGDSYQCGQPALDFYFPGNIVINNAMTGGPVYCAYTPGSAFFPADMNAVGFVNYAGGDYHLALTSAYKSKGTDGKDLGADIDAVLRATAGAAQGTTVTAPWDPGPSPSPSPAPTCSVTYSASLNFSENGGDGVIKVSAPSGCAWTLQSNSPLLKFANASGAGNARVNFTIQPGLVTATPR